MNKKIGLISVLFLMSFLSGAAVRPVDLHFKKELPLLLQLQEAINRDLDRQEEHLEYLEHMPLPTFVQMVKEIAQYDPSVFTVLAYQFGFTWADTSNEHPLVIVGVKKEKELSRELLREWNIFLKNLRFSVVSNDPFLSTIGMV